MLDMLCLHLTHRNTNRQTDYFSVLSVLIETPGMTMPR